MSSAGESLKAGSDFMGALTDAERKSAAYNALNRAYGPAVAYDPATALQAQTYGQREKTNPLEVEQAQANLDTTKHTNAFNTQMNPKKLVEQDATNQGKALGNIKTSQEIDQSDQEFPLTLSEKRANIAQSNAATASSNASTKNSNFELNSKVATQQRTTAMGLLASLSDTAVEGGDIGAAFDKVAPLLAQFQGVDPKSLGPMRAALVQDPTGTINRLSTALAQANTAAASQGGAAGIAAQKAQEQSATQVLALENIAQRTATVPTLIDEATALIPGMSPYAMVRKAREHIPGTAEYQYVQKMETLTSNLALTDLQSMKATGLSLGRVTNMEMGMASKAYANMDIGQDLSTIVKNGTMMQNVYKKVNSNMTEDIKRLSNKAAGTSKLVAPVDAPKGFKGVEGKEYTDAQGNVAVYKNGKFITKAQ